MSDLNTETLSDIKSELVKNFAEIDDAIINYILETISLSKDELLTAEDVEETIGSYLTEIGDENSSIELCSSIFKILKPYANLLYINFSLKIEKNTRDGGEEIQNNDLNLEIKKLVNPIQISSTTADLDNETNMKFESMFDLKRENITYVNSKKLEKAEAKLKQKMDKREGKSTIDVLNYDSSKLASASQSISRKAENQDSVSNKSFDISIQNFDVAFGNRSLLTCANLTLAYGRRYCLIGRNGIGKTTLLKMISSNQLKIPSHIRILHVEQEVHGDDTLAIDSVLECDEKRSSLLKREKEINEKLHSEESKNDIDLNRELEKIFQELEAIEADKAVSRAAKILCGLGFSPEEQKKKTKEFSGGWRMRLALARALFARPDLLLLDEPTNMLDLKAIIWLENYLQTWHGTLLIVSHDRSFLNAVAQEILYLHNQIIEPFRGNYENFLKIRAENLKNQQREYEAQLEYRQHIQLFIDRFRYNANRASQVQSKIKMLEKLPELKPIEKEKEVHFKFPEVEWMNGTILRLDEVDFYYSKERTIFKNVDISATMDSRICIVGENGSGKTTLLKVLIGEFEPKKGIRHTHRALRLGYFTQHHIDGLNLALNSVEVMQEKYPGRQLEEYRGELGKFGVVGDMALQPIVSLSGGQKSRVAFAILSMLRPNFLVLDEPTNHLDMETIEALGEALNKFGGGVILVSHDERLIQLICKELWLCRDGNVKSIEGGYDEYRKLIEAELEY